MCCACRVHTAMCEGNTGFLIKKNLNFVVVSHPRPLKLIQMLSVVNQQPSEVGIAMTTHYHFQIDEAGNPIVPASVFGGGLDVRIKISPRRKILLDAIEVISSVTGQKRPAASKTWRNLDAQCKELIQADLQENESKFNLYCMYL